MGGFEPQGVVTLKDVLAVTNQQMFYPATTWFDDSLATYNPLNCIGLYAAAPVQAPNDEGYAVARIPSNVSQAKIYLVFIQGADNPTRPMVFQWTFLAGLCAQAYDTINRGTFPDTVAAGGTFGTILCDHVFDMSTMGLSPGDYLAFKVTGLAGDAFTDATNLWFLGILIDWS